jgi:diadenosine tetraphosphatase ApaH/serine/threonine PP2A family protein phosphatase
LGDLASQRIDRTICLGDVVGYGADPAPCLARLQPLQPLAVAGNHDWGCIGKLSQSWFNEAARQALLWTRDRLSFVELDALRRLPLVATEESLTIVHATLKSPERFDYIMDLAQAIDTATMCRTSCCLVGHTHVPMLIEYSLVRRSVLRFLIRPEELGEAGLSFDASIRYVMNPGSVGQPRDGDPRASYAVLDSERKTFSVRRIAYDIATAQRKIREAGLPGILADRLAVGR